ncbi:pathogen-associated molecular patterns-induced protein A70-like [Bidens hawaiensis]|uniref:pathogen-associated molecular patterns-induced protein A70-like n=1 Tax=Bidens hawaiensis TaxID=980011 RepID=UPI004049D9D5
MVSMAIASMWASMTAWFTPTVIFCATNLIIATIFIASNNSHHDHDHDHPPTQFSRVSSFLERARSMKFTTWSESEPSTATYSSSSRLAQSIHDEPPLSQPASFFQRVTSFKFSETNPDSPAHQLARSPSIIERLKSFKLSGATSGSTEPETAGSDPEHNNMIRSKSDKTASKKSMSKMKKSRSEMRMAPSDEEEDVDLRRPATARERRSHDVDAKADDFISRFKQQLKLQRLESLVRYNQRLKPE